MNQSPLKKCLIAVMVCLAIPVLAASPPRGSDRLRELVVFPQMDVSFNWGITHQAGEWIVSGTADTANKIFQLSEELKQHPNDAKTLLELGIYLGNRGASSQAQACYEKARKLCLEKIAANPEDGSAMSDMGKSLCGLGKLDEAESFYRRAILVSSNDWQCWVQLGDFLSFKSFFTLFPEPVRNELLPGTPPPRNVLDSHPSAGALQAAEDSLTDASRCYARAAQVAPKAPDVFFQRAGFLVMSNWENGVFEELRGQEISPSAWLAASFSEATVDNLQRAADLSPKNCDYISLTAYFEYVQARARANTPDFGPDDLPENSRERIHNAMTRLENLSQDPDKKLAAEALANLGVLNLTMGNLSAAAPNFRHAVALDPADDEYWDMLMAIVARQSSSPDELVSLGESHLKYKNSAHNHLMLSKAYTYQDKWAEAAAQAEMAAAMDTNDMLATLMLAALDLKQSADDSFVPKAEEQLNYALQLLKSQPSGPAQMKVWRIINLNATICFGLLGSPDELKTANQCLDNILKYFPDDETAKEIRAALD